jgi:alpha-L-fucosidase 2
MSWLPSSVTAIRSYPDLFDVCPPFQIDANFGVPAVIAEMLLQSQNGDSIATRAVRGLEKRKSFWPARAVDFKWT